MRSQLNPFSRRRPEAPALPVRRWPGGSGNPSNGPARLATRYSLPATSGAFTLVEVMMAATILVVGFMGMIQAVTIGSEMLATARRQTLATQIISHELEKLRYVPFATIDGYAAGPTTLTIDSRFNSAIAACGLVTDYSVATNPYIKLERSAVDLVSGSLCEVTFTVTWQKSGTTTAATTLTGSWLEKLSFGGSPPIRRVYMRSGAGYFGKYGLNLSYQRS